MIIDDLNTLVGAKNIHYIYYVTSQQFASGIANISHDFAFKYDISPTLYKATENVFTSVSNDINSKFLNHTTNMNAPESYAGLQHNGILDKLWPPTVENGLMYVCSTMGTLLTIPNIQKGEFAIIGEDTYILNMYPSTVMGNWLKLKSNDVSLYNVQSIPITSHIYVDFKRVDSYVQNGSRDFPFTTLASGYAAATLIANSSNPINIVLISGNTIAENITFNKGHIFLTGDNSSGTHSPIVFTGSLTFTGPNVSISENHFSVSGLALNGVSGTNVINVIGTYPQRLFMKDVWITANGTSHGLSITNANSITHANDSKFSHNGSGDYHCINITAGICNLDSIETSGSTLGIAAIMSGARLNFSNSQIDTAGPYAIEVYGAGSQVTLANCTVTTTAANSIGIILETAGASAIIGNVCFSVPTSATTGKAIDGVSGTFLFYGKIYYLPNSSGVTTNTQINTLITKSPIASFG
jgi:hypothetical protein